MTGTTCFTFQSNNPLMTAIEVYLAKNEPRLVELCLEDLFKETNVNIIGLHENSICMSRIVATDDGTPFENRRLSLARDSSTDARVVFDVYSQKDGQRYSESKKYTPDALIHYFNQLMC